LHSCPFDYVRIYDGASNASEPIGSYCGQWTGVTVYSTGESMYIEFVTKSGRTDPFLVMPSSRSHAASVTPAVQRRGFKASFDITDRFVDLGAYTPAFHFSAIFLRFLLAKWKLICLVFPSLFTRSDE